MVNTQLGSASFDINGDLDAMDPSQTLRMIADSLPSGDLKTSVYQLAAELEVQHKRQNNAFQGALGNAELGLGNQIGALKSMIQELRVICNSSLAQSQSNATTIQELCDKVAALQQAVGAGHSDVP